MKPRFWSSRFITRRWRWALPTLLVGTIGAAVWLIDGSIEWPSASQVVARQDSMGWKLVLDPNEPTTIVVQDSPEQMVRQIYRHLGEGERALALAVAENLASRYPNFQLGQLLYADLLNISLREPVQGPDMDQEGKPAAQRRLQELVLESTRRLLHPPVADLKDKVPTGLLYLDPAHHPYVMAVDTSHSRLYWFANRAQPNGLPRLQLLMDTYISVGSQGVGKEREGDGRTPLGVYFIQKNLPGGTLPDLFGSGALTLNYPNAIDVMRKRTGSGIWLHGTPSAQYSRAPEATDGCVVLSNPEMARLLGLGSLRLTPVLIARELQWRQTDQAAPEQPALMSRLEAWNQARLQDDDGALRSHYSERFERDGLGLEPWWSRLRSIGVNRSNARPLEMLSAVRWKDDEDLMVVTWLDPNRSAAQRNEYLRTYWALEGGSWKIVFEGPV
ncbi:MAG: L,D-transpeptidase family protein [Limnohabitans sp.]